MKKTIRFIVVISAITLLTSCSGTKQIDEAEIPEAVVAESETVSNPVIEETESETVEAVPYEDPETLLYQVDRNEKDGMISSYLTGMRVPAVIGKRRPVAVMMSNDKEASPQYGINHAGVVYEAPAEGGMNRFMSIIEDYDMLERIGSVRSCRTYYIYFANEWDAIYAHYGQSSFAKPELVNIDNINGIEGIGTEAFYRTKDKKSPHNAYTSGERLNKAIIKLGYSIEYPDDYHGHFLFAKDGITVDPSPISKEVYKIVPGYYYNEPWFEYHEDDGLYYRFQYGEPHMGDEGQIAVTNVIIQYMATMHYGDTPYLYMNTQADSVGWYFTNGKACMINTKKYDEFGVVHYYDPNGEEIILNQGKTWICAIQSSRGEYLKLFDKNGVNIIEQQ